MKYISTRNINLQYSFSEAIIKGLADDGGLFLPDSIPSFNKEFLKNRSQKTLQEISFETAKLFLKDEINDNDLEIIINSSINFDAPVLNLYDNIFVQELFHGPTLAFKDFGARFMAHTLSHLNKKENKELTILVATSGDTGSAVANGFYNVEGINVILLYPSKGVSSIQEQQLTTLGKNITALEIGGTFDDCQSLVKQSFQDKEINNLLKLTSANSINIGRLIPQCFYYVYAFSKLKDSFSNIIVSVPSGNLGNLTAGLFAKKFGIDIKYYISATNSNNVFTEFIENGNFNPRSSVKTISNAMDVGNPSNFERINFLFNNNLREIRNNIKSKSFSDEETKMKIKECYDKYNYILDPHGAVGLSALEYYIKKEKGTAGVFLETAHPAKFKDVIDGTLNIKLPIPEVLMNSINKKKVSTLLPNNFEQFKEYLLYNKG